MTDASTLRSDARAESAQRSAPSGDSRLERARTAFGDAVVDHYVHAAQWEQGEYDRRITDWELKRGFERS